MPRRGIEHPRNSFGHFPFISHESKKLVTSVLRAWEEEGGGGGDTTLLNNWGGVSKKNNNNKKYPQKVQEFCFVSMEEIHFKLYKWYQKEEKILPFKNSGTALQKIKQ